MNKIHTSSAQDVPDKLALSWKAVTYSITDGKTPLISQYCDMVIRNLKVDLTDESWSLAHLPKALKRDLP